MNIFQQIYFTYLRVRNELDYPLRKRLTFRSSPVAGSPAKSKDILDSYPADERLKVKETLSNLNRQYHFQYFNDNHSIDESKENYYYLSMLDDAFQRSSIKLPATIKAADIGPSSWFYAHALSAALGLFGQSEKRSFHLTGYEIDAYRMYSDFHTRKDHALGNIQGLNSVEYLDQGFRETTSTYDVITMFFPFIFEKDHLEWGLPQRYFDPGALLKSAWNSLKPGGLLLIVNQGPDEHKAQLSLMKVLQIPVCTAFRVESLLFTYELDRYAITAKHP